MCVEALGFFEGPTKAEPANGSSIVFCPAFDAKPNQAREAGLQKANERPPDKFDLLLNSTPDSLLAFHLTFVLTFDREFGVAHLNRDSSFQSTYIMDVKSILLANLPHDPQAQTRTIINTFGRFYHIPESTFHYNNDNELPKNKSGNFGQCKAQLDLILKALYKHYDPDLIAEELCQDLVQLDIKRFDTFKQKWNPNRLGKVFNKDLNSGFDVREFTQRLEEIYDTSPEVLDQTWTQIQGRYDKIKSVLDKKFGHVIEIKKMIQSLQRDDKGLYDFKDSWVLIVEKLKRSEMHQSELGSQIDKLNKILEEADIWTRKNHAIWIQYSAMLLQNLANDISLIRSIDAENWNLEILKEVIGLMDSIGGFFSGLDVQLALPDLVVSEFTKASNEVEREHALLHDHLLKSKEKEKMGQILEGQSCGKVSAKTIRELYVLNKLSQGVLNGCLRYTDQSDVQKLILDIDLELKNLSKQEVFGSGLAWVPKMIAVVLDLHTGFLLTGATQPDCKDHPILREAARRIPHLQVGRYFEPIIARCYNAWRDENCAGLKKQYSKDLKSLKELKTDEEKKEYSDKLGKWSEEELEKLFPQEKPPVYHQLPAPEQDAKKDSKIMSWAVSGYTFHLQSPCPRCAYFYSTWDLHKEEEFSNKAYLLNYLNGGRADAKEDKAFHCAETVAGAQIYAWRHEALEFG